MNRTLTVTLADIPEPPTEYTMTVQPVGESQRIGRFFYRFLGLVEGEPKPRPFEVFLDMDRRQARRLARRTGKRFSWRQRRAVWR